MPVLHQYKLIFIHVPKTGGQSIEKALGIYGVNNCGSNEADFNIGYGIFQEKKALQHCTLDEMLSFKLVSKQQIQQYFKFAFVRNPWDRVVSEYHWNIEIPDKPKHFYPGITFSEFVDLYIENRTLEAHITDDHFSLQSDFVYNSEGQLVVDYLGRFENLKKDFHKICRINRVPCEKFPHVRKTTHEHYSVYYDHKSKKQVEKYYQKDIDHFKYAFENY
ncbi:MAG: sulfotransferase family 2 domain-containing protein [Candidatus Omnitrophica bacterium]|nr:sulfotransferase family 2 domain-containing protein [Candidatus Omnitrophota bacterium]